MHYDNTLRRFQKKMQLIFLAGGKGTRMQLEPLGVNKKCLVPLNGIPLLGHLIQSLKNYINLDLATIFVIPKSDNSIIEYVRGLRIKAEFVEQEKPDGIVNAMLLAKDKLMTNEGLFVLADIVLKGVIAREWQIKPKNPSLFIWNQAPNSATGNNFGVEIDRGKIVGVIEKPSRSNGLYCGMGLYFFD
ncbi:MAG: NTP transferase domain-containing protein, partial [Desulfobacterales bacterium]|nr:NTP transferase domain-containing protein [Desulfobacterales bacterium]